MARILVIDDDRIIRTIVSKSLSSLGYDVITASDGLEGLRLVKAEKPDAVVTDKMMPGIDGFEVTRRLRREPGFAHLPILVLTSESDLEDRVGAFEAGADDYLSKPFETAELAARLTALLRKAEALRAVESTGMAVDSEDAQFIAVHSLRGGIGSSSLAVNLAISLASLWQSPTLLLDMVLSSGQIALMLNSPLKRTWADLGNISTDELDIDVLKKIMGLHDSRVQFISAPGNPTATESFDHSLMGTAVSILRPRFEYMIADLPHDFSDISLDILDAADYVLLLMAPEMASVRTAAIALDTYKKLGYGNNKIKLVLNWTFEHGGLASKKIETALNHPISLVLPFAPTRFVSAINRGVPLLHSHPEDPVSGLIEDFAFRLSKEAHQGIPPAAPSAAWHRVNERLQLFGGKNRKKTTFLSF
ncbi:MAG: response regulator [Ardenticatenaceae bacterium]|nr:response regulator [Ardenticatenaceae bacterium]MCB9443298.1 response regulator [Ardenticatenaceae bacterium]